MHIHNQLQERLPALNHHMTNDKVLWQCTTKWKEDMIKSAKSFPLLFLSCGLVHFFALCEHNYTMSTQAQKLWIKNIVRYATLRENGHLFQYTAQLERNLLLLTPKSCAAWVRKAIPINYLDSSITVINTTNPLIRVISAFNWSKLIFTSSWSMRVIFTSNKSIRLIFTTNPQ